MPMTEFPRFAMGDSGACSGKRACHLANWARFPLRPVTNEHGDLIAAFRSVALPKIMEQRIGRARLCRANGDRDVSGGKSLLRSRDQAAATEDGRSPKKPRSLMICVTSGVTIFSQPLSPVCNLASASGGKILRYSG